MIPIIFPGWFRRNEIVYPGSLFQGTIFELSPMISPNFSQVDAKKDTIEDNKIPEIQIIFLLP
jgi:hypothetical protein